MNKCKCGRPATVGVREYDFTNNKYKNVVYKCDHHFKNDVSDGVNAYKVSRLDLFREDLIIHTVGDSGRC